MPIRPQSPQYWRNAKYKPKNPKNTADIRGGSYSSKKNKEKKEKGGFIKNIMGFVFSKKAFSLLFFLILALFLTGTITILWLSKGLPNPNRLMEREVAESTQIFDRTGETVLYEIHGDEKRTMVVLENIPKHVRDATIAIEDKNFYKHRGISLWAIFRTAITNVLTGKKAGGSTLTQQFVKNAVLTSEKSYIRKAKEIIMAYRLEKKFSKDEILQLYFNEIPYGSNAYGIEAASQKYFGKNVTNLSLAEGAILAAIVQTPTRYSPYGPNKDLLLSRQHYVLDIMEEQGMISKEERDLAKEENLVFKSATDDIIAPHFVMHIREMLSTKYGEKTIEQGGLKIYTTLDLYKQQIAEEVLKKQAEENQKTHNASNASLVSIDPKNGQVLAMVGSKDYFDESIDGQVNVALKDRQPGSSFKPIVYAQAFSKGYNMNTIVYDVHTNFAASGDPYEPKNYTGQEYGAVSLKSALAGSLNIASVKAFYLAGPRETLDLAKALGYTTLLDPDRFGLSLVLGGGEVKLLEHTNAFSAFAREGLVNNPSFILKVEDRNGKIIEEFKQEERRVLDGNVARQINAILSDNNERAYIFGARSYLNLGDRPAGVKTGTTNNNRDAWTVGYTPSLVTGVWVGNNDNSQMKSTADGSVVAAPIWNEYMKRVLGNDNIETFNKPEIKPTGKSILDGVGSEEKVLKINKLSGLLANENTPEEYIEEKTYKEVRSILYYVNKNDPLGPAPTNPADDPQFNLWENAIKNWAERNNIITESPPTEYDNNHTQENKPIFELNVEDGFSTPFSYLSISIKASAPRGVATVEYFLNGTILHSANEYPFSMEKSIEGTPAGFNELKVVVCDDIKNCSEKIINFNLVK